MILGLQALALHHQHFRRPDVMIDSYKFAPKRMNPHLNPHAKEFIPPIDNDRPEEQKSNMIITQGITTSTVDTKSNSNVYGEKVNYHNENMEQWKESGNNVKSMSAMPL